MDLSFIVIADFNGTIFTLWDEGEICLFMSTSRSRKIKYDKFEIMFIEPMLGDM